MAERDGQKLILVVLTGGGFTFETRRLLDSLGGDVSFVFLRTNKGGTPGEHGIPLGPARIIPQFATKTKSFLGRSAYAFLVTMATTWSVLRAQPVSAVLVVGCSHAVPVFVVSRLLGRPTIYLESVTRADQLSATGKIVYWGRLARLFMIQWPDLQKSYPRSRLGTIL